ncbi:hypothetical protein HS7_05110 [Sulfolobales archaeon HS-7]|nr:hypothetical protein HS7_05110 [Sulfolobales archaeon HS-7]
MDFGTKTLELLVLYYEHVNEKLAQKNFEDFKESMD